LGNDTASRLQESFASISNYLDDVLFVKAKRAKRLGNEDIATFRKADFV
jgi:hypothetical protein